MSGYKQLLQNSTQYQDVVRYIGADMCPSGIVGLPPAPKAHLVFSLCEEFSRRAIVVLPDESSARKFTADINELNGNKEVAFFYPARDFSFNSSQGQSREYEQLRIKTLCSILKDDCKIVVCSAESSLQLTIPPKELKKRTFKIDFNTEVSTEKVTETLISAGFKRAESVEGAGQFAVRGGIIDFFPPDSSQPVRIELWGDEVDTISLFETYDLICITDIDGNVSSYNGLSFYKSDEYYSLFNKLSLDNNITYSFDLDSDICEVIYKRIEVLNENTCNDFTMSGMTVDASVVFASPNKDDGSEKLKEIAECIYSVYYCDRTNLADKLTNYQCCGLIFQDDCIYYIDDLSSGISEKLSLLHPNDSFKGNAGKYEYGNNKHSIIVEIYDETNKCIIARIRIADPEKVNAIEKLWTDMSNLMNANDPQKVFKPSNYRIVVYMNGVSESFYYKYNDTCNEWAYNVPENFSANMFPMTGSSSLATYLNKTILNVVGDVFQ